MPGLRRALVIVVLAILSIVIFLTCSSDSPNQSNDPIKNTVDTITVSVVDPNPTSLSWTKINGLPENNGDLYGIVYPISATNFKAASDHAAADPIDSSFTFIYQSDSGNYMMTPLNPSDPTGGGAIEIIITDDGSIVSEPILLTLQALPEAPGEFSSIVSLMQQELDQKLRLAGTTREELRTTAVADLPLEYLPLFIGFDGLDNPDNPNSLRAIADGSAPLADSLDVDLLDRVVAQTGYKAYLQDFVYGLDSIETPPQISKHTTLGEAARMASSSDACIDGPDLGITDCAGLAAAMEVHAELEKAARSAANKVLTDITNNSLLLLGAIPGGGEIASAAFGTVLFIEAKIAEGRTALYPSVFVDEATSFNPSKTTFEEDFTEPGNWTEFNVSAVSQGWKLDQSILEAIAQALSVKGGVDAVGTVPPQFDDFINGLDETVKQTAITPGTSEVIGEFAGGSDIVEICPHTWSNINCVDENYSDAIVSSGPLSVDEPAHTFEPTDLGSSILRIETNDSFGDEQTGTAATITTNGIQVFIDPFQAEADTNETITFHARVENALDQRVSFTLDNGGSLVYADTDSAKVKTPSSPWDPPLELVATSLAETGLRANAGDFIEDSAPITYNGVGQAFLSPGYACVKPGESKTFTVSYTGGAINTVTWSLDPAGVGSLSESFTSATYTAPNDPGAQITIGARVNDASTATADISVSSCRCSWVFEATGSGYSYSSSGGWAPASDFGGALAVTLKETEADNDLPLLGFSVTDVFQAGIYQTSDISYTGVDQLTWAVGDPNLTWPTIEVESYVQGDYIEGVAYGTLSRVNDLSEYEYVTFNLSFRAEFFNLDRSQCSDSTGM